MSGPSFQSLQRNTAKVTNVGSQSQCNVCVPVIDNDVILQLDCPDLAMGRHHAYRK